MSRLVTVVKDGRVVTNISIDSRTAQAAKMRVTVFIVLGVEGGKVLYVDVGST